MLQRTATVRSMLLNSLRSEFLLGTLVALLSVLTALAAYLGGLADSAAGDANVEGQKVLSLANTDYLEASNEVVQDYAMYDAYYLNQTKEPALSRYYREFFSKQLEESLEREDGLWDDIYYSAMFEKAEASRAQAIAEFEKAQRAGNLANQYQMVGLMFAVALALSAWASIIRTESGLRPLFAIIALVILIYGLAHFFNLYLAQGVHPT